MNAFNNLKTGIKLIGGFITVALILAVVAVMGYINMKSINADTIALFESTGPIEDLGQADVALFQIRGDVYKLVFFPEERTTSEQAISSGIAEVNRLLAKYRPTATGKEKDELTKFDTAWATYQQAVAVIIGNLKAGDEKAANDGLRVGAVAPTARLAAAESLNNLVLLSNQRADEVNKRGAATFANATNIIVVSGVFGVLLAGALGFFISRAITRPLQIVTQASQQIAETDLSTLAAELGKLAQGDLTRSFAIKAQPVNIHSRDEVGDLAQAFNHMIAQLQEAGRAYNAMLSYLAEMAQAANQLAQGDVTAQVSPRSTQDVLGNAFVQMVTSLNSTLHQTNAVTGQVVQAVEQVRSVSQDLAANAEEQSAAVEEVASSVEETDSQVKASAENASTANQLASQTTSLANAGQEKMKALTGSMHSIARSSQEIAKIIKVIDEIAFQTNLLALNAAVEAARAGQHGKGFAVVAQEVRNLAERSAKAAKSTAELIEDSGRKVQEGVTMTEATGHALTEIVQNVVKVKDLVGEIAAASEEQSKALAQINQAITQVSQGTQSNSAQSEELASTADELGGLADRLREEVARFKLRQNGHALGGALPAGVTPELLQAALAALQKQAEAKGLAGGKRGANGGQRVLAEVDRDERGYGNF